MAFLLGQRTARVKGARRGASLPPVTATATATLCSADHLFRPFRLRLSGRLARDVAALAVIAGAPVAFFAIRPPIGEASARGR